MKTCARHATGSTTRSLVDPRPLNVAGAPPTALRHVQHRRPPRPAAPGSFAPHIVTCDWPALVIWLGRAAFGLQRAVFRPPAVAVQPLFVAFRLAGFALPPGRVARWLPLPDVSHRLERSVVYPAFALALAHIGWRGCAA